MLHSLYDATLEYLRRVLLAADEFLNVVLGGQPGDSISHRAAVARNNGEEWGCVLCKILNVFEADHCDKSIAAFDAAVSKAAETLTPSNR